MGSGCGVCAGLSAVSGFTVTAGFTFVSVFAVLTGLLETAGWVLAAFVPAGSGGALDSGLSVASGLLLVGASGFARVLAWLAVPRVSVDVEGLDATWSAGVELDSADGVLSGVLAGDWGFVSRTLVFATVLLVVDPAVLCALGRATDFALATGDAVEVLDLDFFLLLEGFFAMLHSLLRFRARGLGYRGLKSGGSGGSVRGPLHHRDRLKHNTGHGRKVQAE